MLLVAVINGDAFPFLAFLDLTFHLEDARIVFSGCTELPDSKETKLWSNNQEVSPSVGKIKRIVLVPCWTWKCASTAMFDGVDIPKVPGCHLLQQASL